MEYALNNYTFRECCGQSIRECDDCDCFECKTCGESNYEQESPSDEEVFTVEEALEAYEKFKQKQLLIEWIPAVISRKRGNVSFDTGAQRRAKSLLEEINVELTS